MKTTGSSASEFVIVVVIIADLLHVSYIAQFFTFVGADSDLDSLSFIISSATLFLVKLFVF